MNKTMKVVAIDRFGGIETLKTGQLPIPAVDANEVLVRVEAAGVGVWDPFEREGGFAKEYNVQTTFPLVLGSDGAGTVEAVGDSVQALKKGDRVYGIALMNPKGGFYAQYIVLKETNLSRIPAKAKLTIQQAGAMPVDAITALAGLDATLGLKANESILILGASGGIGHLAVQLAKRMGARVLAVASGEDGVALVRQDLADELEPGLMVVFRHRFTQRSAPKAALAADDAGPRQRQRPVAHKAIAAKEILALILIVPMLGDGERRRQATNYGAASFLPSRSTLNA